MHVVMEWKKIQQNQFAGGEKRQSKEMHAHNTRLAANIILAMGF